MRIAIPAVAGAFLALLVQTTAVSAAGADSHRLALQVSDNNPAKMTEALNLAATVSKNYAEKGEEVEIEIVTFAGGLHMMRSDTSPVIERLRTFEKSMPNVTFVACSSTRQVMQRNEGKDIPIFEGAKHLPGIIRLMELDRQGWTIIRP